MTNSVRARRAIAAIAVSGILGGCSNGGSPPNFAPPESTQRSVIRTLPHGSVPYTYYTLRLLTLGGVGNESDSINDRSQVSGISLLPGNSVQHAAIWRQYRPTDLGTLGGPNSGVFSNKSIEGQFVGFSDSSQTDPNAEDFCGFGTSDICLGFSWQNGKIAPLPTLGGNNAQALDVNNRGQIVGLSETSTKDASCPSPQVYDYYGVIWQPNGKITTLPPYSGDTVSVATSINRTGAVAGFSGSCAASATHAVLWNLGSTIDLGNLGGSETQPYELNNVVQITGASLVSGDTHAHAFLWQNGTITDLGKLPGDVDSYGLGINDKGQIVGQSCTATSCRGFLWQNGTMTDLNTLISPKSTLYIYAAVDINNSGQIAATAINTANHVRAVVLVPGRKADSLPGAVSAPKITVPENLRMHLEKFRFGPLRSTRLTVRH